MRCSHAFGRLYWTYSGTNSPLSSTSGGVLAIVGGSQTGPRHGNICHVDAFSLPGTIDRNRFYSIMIAAVLALSAPHQSAGAGTPMVKFEREARFSVAAPDRDVTEFAWSPDGRQVAVLSATVRRANVYSIPEGTRLAGIGDLAGAASSIAYASDGRVVLPLHADANGGLSLWNPTTDEITTVESPSPDSDIIGRKVDDFALDSRRTLLAGTQIVKQGAGRTTLIALYDARRWTVLARLPVATTKIAISPTKDKLAVIGQGGMVLIVDAASGAQLGEFAANRNRVKLLEWSRDGERLVTGNVGQGYGLDRETGQYGELLDEHVLQLWSPASGKRLAVAPIPVGGGVESIEFSGDGRWLVTVTSDRVCRVWDAKTLALAQTVATDLGPTSAVARFSPDSSRILIIRKSDAEAMLFRTR